jgi:LmbE family N-acetylglucosaminyl deacetylase
MAKEYPTAHGAFPSQPGLLAVFAHPDDESFGPGGTLALYAQRGVRVDLICATRGEVGDFPPGFTNPFASLAELREHELSCAAQQLGIHQVHFLGYRDSGMVGSQENAHPDALVNVPLERLAEEITAFIRRLRPQVVITFDPFGGYGHPDHIAIHRATLEAFHAAGDPQRFPSAGDPFQPAKLYYATFPRRAVRWMVFLMRLRGMDPTRWGRNQDIDLQAIARQQFPIHARINIRAVGEIKERARQCHASQLPGGDSPPLLVRLLMRANRHHETFSRAHPPAPPRLRENDLFADLP